MKTVSAKVCGLSTATRTLFLRLIFSNVIFQNSEQNKQISSGLDCSVHVCRNVILKCQTVTSPIFAC